MLKNYGFHYYFSSRSNDDTSLMDEWLGQLLNPDGVIQIADHIYKVDLNKEKVYVINTQYKETHYNSLINGVGDQVAEYSIEDYVIDEVTDSSPDAQAKRRQCTGIGGVTYVSASTSSDIIIKTFDDGCVWRLESYVKFFRAGIYYRLSSGHKVWEVPHKFSSGEYGSIVSNSIFSNDPTILFIKQGIKGHQAWWKKLPCKSNSVGTRESTLLHYLSSKPTYQTSLYLGIRNLNGYYFFVRSNAHRTNGTETDYTNYAGRNINSPY